MIRYLEDFSKDLQFKSPVRTITEDDLTKFAELTGDVIGFHTDGQSARSSHFGVRVAHGALVFSISVGLTTQMDLINETLIAFYRVDKLRFVRPVLVGDALRVQKRPREVELVRPEAGLITYSTVVVNQNEEIVMRCLDAFHDKRRPAENA
jgi:acyl dehydratase